MDVPTGLGGATMGQVGSLDPVDIHIYPLNWLNFYAFDPTISIELPQVWNNSAKTISLPYF